MPETNTKHKVVIVGGGFGGIRAALELAKKRIPDLTLTLITNKPHFEYNPALYRYVTGSSAIEVCIPLPEIFAGLTIEIVQDSITALDRTGKKLTGSSGKVYDYDMLIMALGSETTYFGIPGLKENSYGMKTVAEALKLKNHITDVLLLCREDASKGSHLNHDAAFVVIGAGATGVEMAGRLIEYARKVAREIGVDPALVSVTMIEAAPKILQILPQDFTDPIDAHLRKLGVSIMLSTAVMKQEVEEIFLKDAKMMTSTVIWTSGVRANGLYEASGLPVDKRGKVEVDEHLNVKGDEAMYVIGDAALTTYSGWAQTAFYDGAFVSKVIAAKLTGNKMPVYKPQAPVNAIPAGDGWAGVLITWFGSNIRFYGRIGWWFRRLADLRSFMVILPLGKALKIFFGGCISAKCEVCIDKSNVTHDK